MFVPIGDDNPLKSIRFQYVTVALIIANVLTFLFEQSPASTDAVIASFAVVPHELFQVNVFGGGPAPVSGDQIAVPRNSRACRQGRLQSPTTCCPESLQTDFACHGDHGVLIGQTARLDQSSQ